MGVTSPFHSPHFHLALPAMTQFSEWYRHCPSALRTCPFQGLQPNHFTSGLHPSSVDVPVDIQGTSCNFPFFHPREALLVGCRVTALPSCSCGILFSSPPIEGGTGTPVLYDGCLYTREHQPLTRQEEAGFGGGPVTICVGLSLHRRGHQPWFGLPPHKSLLPTYPRSSSFPSRHLPSLVPGHQVSSSLHLFFCHSTLSVGMLLQLIGACTSHRALYSLSLTEAMYMSTLLAEASLVWASLLPTVGKTKSTGSLGHHPNIK